MQFGFPHAGVKANGEACASLLNDSSRQMAVTAPVPRRIADAIAKARGEYEEMKARAKFGGGPLALRRLRKRQFVKALRAQAKLAIAEALS